MKHLSLITLAVILTFSLTAQKAKKGDFNPSTNYEVQVLGVGQDGTKVFRIWNTAANVNDAIAEAKRNAIAVCLFRGLPGSGFTNQTPAICQIGDEIKHKEFFDEFFQLPKKDGTGGMYLRFVNRTTDEPPSGQFRVKVKKGYKVAIDVQVRYNDLRKYMEEKGIVKKLDSGF
ncbi:hypothetical protein LJC25_00130 [Bacteroidales bacterium OttesenSCG-928-K03]|nr:hypothetical protein [Bacteroidales bacterium OttesenSCG-928-K03]